jgi:membrane associated rhomboid family serine protease
MGFGPAITPMVQKLLIANGVIFFLQFIIPAIVPLGAISVAGFFQGMIWQPFTYMWLHGGLMHVFMNMFVLWMFGPQLEGLWGSQRFLRFYLICGVGAGFVILIWNLLVGAFLPGSQLYYIPTLGASGAIYGLLTAFSLTWPDRTIMLLFPPMPVKAIWFIPLLFVLQFAMGGGHNVSHAGHLGGVIVAGFLMRRELGSYFSFSSVRFKWHRWRMRRRLRSVQQDEVERRRRARDDEQPPTVH